MAAAFVASAAAFGLVSQHIQLERRSCYLGSPPRYQSRFAWTIGVLLRYLFHGSSFSSVLIDGCGARFFWDITSPDGPRHHMTSSEDGDPQRCFVHLQLNTLGISLNVMWVNVTMCSVTVYNARFAFDVGNLLHKSEKKIPKWFSMMYSKQCNSVFQGIHIFSL